MPQPTAGGVPPSEGDTLLYEGESRWFRNVRQLTHTGMGLDKAGEAYFSADGQRICFQAYPHGQDEYQIYVMNVDGTGLKMVSTGKAATTCAFFHPDGEKMIFAANHHDPRPPVTPEAVRQAAEQQAGRSNYVWPFPPGMDIFEYTFKTGDMRRLTEAEGYDAEGSYSGDGKRIVFTSMRDGDQDIYICDADGTNVRRITDKPGYDGGPFFSPDGKRIIYRSDRFNNGNLQIFVNSVEGGQEKQLTNDPDVLHWCPFWHPSGKWLIFTRAEHAAGRPNYDLYLLSDDGEKTIRVTTDPAFDGLPVFSPDGRHIMWTSKRGDLDGAQVFIADVVGISPSGEVTAKPD